MFEIADITSRERRQIAHFSYRQARGTTQVLLSQNADFLDGLQGLLTGKEALADGYIALDGKRCQPQQAAFVTRTCRMYPEQTVIANVFTDMGFRQLGSQSGQEMYEKLTREAGFFVEPYRVVSQLTITEQKMVEMLRVFYQKPALLVIRGLSNFVSVETFQKMLQLVQRLNAEGTTVLYLTNRLEEAILLPYGITVVDNGRIQGTYAPQEITADPRSIFFISMGAQKPELGEKPRGREGGAERGTDTWENIRMFARYLVREMSAAAAAVFLLDADDFLYGMTKAALKRACESIAIDLSPYGIRVNCVAPGATWTHAGAAHESLQNGGIPMGRLGTPKDVADLVAYLISDAAWMIDGFQVRIDGGLILSGLPEGWADAKFINPAWVQENYEKVMNMTGN